MAERKVCVVTGSRADYGLLYWVMKEIDRHPALELQVAATGMHFSARHGETWRVIEEDGFRINERVDTAQVDDSLLEVTRAVGRGVIGFAAAFERLDPDIVLILGDRFEIFAAAQAALLESRPLAHIAGGDVTEGALDDALRHAMTKIAHLHFVTNTQAEARVRQLGEDPARIFNTGSPGIDTIRRARLLTRAELEAALQVKLQPRLLLVTFHPATLETERPEAQFGALLEALDEIRSRQPMSLVFTMPNADPGNESIAALIRAYVARHDHAHAFVSLGQQKYLSLMREAAAVVGNSSSGLYEAPSFKVPTVNIGERQKGRPQASSVLNCAPRRQDIAAAIRRALEMDCAATVNPYGDGDSAKRIVGHLAALPDPRALLRKRFVDAR
jgi:UDP-N-acetylglucosamine 2-epimerase (non-hydrolysing)/GDP/UDP-N,N'-diacetylbacillosamine 2-epimerase (hydrolysing)